jgi:hypothetical protein
LEDLAGRGGVFMFWGLNCQVGSLDSQGRRQSVDGRRTRAGFAELGGGHGTRADPRGYGKALSGQVSGLTEAPEKLAIDGWKTDGVWTHTISMQSEAVD